jgi:hypothetical protein
MKGECGKILTGSLVVFFRVIGVIRIFFFPCRAL